MMDSLTETCCVLLMLTKVKCWSMLSLAVKQYLNRTSSQEFTQSDSVIYCSARMIAYFKHSLPGCYSCRSFELIEPHSSGYS